jgi:hypothetical protein
MDLINQLYGNFFDLDKYAKTADPGSQFNDFALKLFRYQYENNAVYKNYVNSIGIDIGSIRAYDEIPFLPIEFFKTQQIISGSHHVQKTFTSSGTTQSNLSRHYVADLAIYTESFTKGFNFFYGSHREYNLLCLLPSYLEREGSSLIYMTDHLIKQSREEFSGFYLSNTDELIARLLELEAKNKNALLLGVSYALLDMVEKRSFNLRHTIVMETGGMKGKRKEMIREELHAVLCKGFGLEVIHSEYGMTELLSQAYSKGNGKFNCPPWMSVLIRDTNDPLKIIGTQRTGGVNVIDFANIYSCSFIATQDLGRLNADGSFEVMGRFDNSDLRGCNLMIS